MMAVPAPTLRTLAFGDPDGRIWGGALDAGSTALVFGADDTTGAAAGKQAIAWSQDAQGWRLAGEAFELLVSPAPLADPTAQPPEELCQVSGRIVLGGVEHAVQCPGARSVATGPNVGEIESMRAVSGWFGDDDAVSLLALRPIGSSGSDRDRLVATVFGPEGPVTVDEPRLSTSYGGDGRPSATNLELWIGEGEEQVSQRTAGEARGGGASAQADGIRLQVTPLRCHSRGLDGAGVYLLARF